jgi:hypothetical protein
MGVGRVVVKAMGIFQAFGEYLKQEFFGAFNYKTPNIG